MKDKRKIEILDQFFDSSITTDSDKSLYTDYNCYEEITADGYSVYVFEPLNEKINICENVHYYDDQLCDTVLYTYEHECCFIYVDEEISDNIDLKNEQLGLFEEYLSDIIKSDLLTEEERIKLLENEEI